MRMLFNMIRISTLFGQFASGGTLEKISLDLICMMKEDSYHSMDTILQLGEVSDKLFFVTKGKVGVFVNTNAIDYYHGE